MKLGAFCLINDGTAIAKQAEYESWLGRPLDYLLQFPPGGDWAAITGSANGGLAWWIRQFKDYPRKERLIISLCMLPATGASHAIGATGAYNTYWREVAQRLVDNGFGKSILRPGWEFSGNWYPWGITAATTGAFRDHWRQMVTAMKAVPGAAFTFLWNDGPGWRPYDPFATCYPGNDYVDIIGMDTYDVASYYNVAGYPSGIPKWQLDSCRNNAWKSYTEWGTYPMNWWATQAAAVGRPLAIVEWGCDKPADPARTGYGGQDNPFYIQKMYDWCMNPANNVAFASYFEWGDGDDARNCALCFSEQYPQAKAVYKTAFGAIPYVPPIDPPPPPPPSDHELLLSVKGVEFTLDGASKTGDITVSIKYK